MHPIAQIQETLLINDDVPGPVLGAVTDLTSTDIITTTKKNGS